MQGGDFQRTKPTLLRIKDYSVLGAQAMLYCRHKCRRNFQNDLVSENKKIINLLKTPREQDN